VSDLNIKPILEWFQQAKPNPTTEDACVQIGCHYEEVAEMSEVMSDDSVQHELEYCSENYKAVMDWCYASIEYISDDEKRELLDSLCDQIVTAIGVAYMIGFDIEKALAEVNRSNWSKFVDGKPVFNEQGKIAKPESYSPPELKEFIK